MANNNEDPKPIRKTWTMLKKAIQIPQHTNGMTVCWDGLDNLNASNQWVDKISGYTFSLDNAKVIPVHEKNVYNFKAIGGMRSNFETPSTADVSWTIEIVTRDIRNSVPYLSDDWGVVIHPGLNSSWKDVYHGITLRKQQTTNPYTIFMAVNQVGGISMPIADFKENEMDTWTWVPMRGLYRNGVCIKAFETTKTINPFKLSLAIPFLDSSVNDCYRLKCKIHEVRYYPFELTDKQIADNYQADLYKYDFHMDTKKYVADGLKSFYAGYTAFAENSMWMDPVGLNHIMMYNNPVFDEQNQMWKFNGTNQYGLANNKTAPSGDFTLEYYTSLDEIASNAQAWVFFGGNFNWYAGYGAVLKMLPVDKGAASFVGAKSSQAGSVIKIANDITNIGLKTKVVLRRTKADGKISLYVENINGVYTEEITGPKGDIAPNPQQLTVGAGNIRSDSKSHYGKSNIYAIRVYNRVLTDQEIQQNHQEDIKIYGK